MKIDELKKQNEEEGKKLDNVDQNAGVNLDNDAQQNAIINKNSDADADANSDAKAKEPWQMTVEEENNNVDDSQTSGDVPLKAHLKIKHKLKGRLDDANEDIERLKAELERIKTNAATTSNGIKMPVPEDYETDEAYAKDKEKYDDMKAEERYKKLFAKQQQQQIIAQAAAKRQKAVDEHYDRASELINDAGISPDLFKDTDKKVRQAVDSIMPGVGDIITDQIISVLGKGSEKVLYYLGVNDAALYKFQSLLASDKTGMKAAIYLGQQQQKLLNPMRIQSKTPSPAARHSGDNNTSLSTDKQAKALKKKYDDSHKTGSIQDAYLAKKEARKAGIDVSTW